MSAIISDTQRTASCPVVGMAPMDGITDFPFRLWMGCIGGADFFVTPFVRVTKGFRYERLSQQFCPESFALRGLFRVPVTPQIMGDSPEDIARVAAPMLELVSHVDLNCGCPAPTVVRHGAGSALLHSPEVFERFLSDVEGLLGRERYSVKMRTGLRDHTQFDELIDVLTRLHPSLVTIHPRTQKQGYGGVAQWESVDKMSRKLSCPVWGSGDVTDRESFQRLTSLAPVAQGVMIGRGALCDPWVFLRLRKSVHISPSMVAWSLAMFSLCVAACDEGDSTAFTLAERLSENPCGDEAEAWRERVSDVALGLMALPVSKIWRRGGNHVLHRLKQITKFLSCDLLPCPKSGLLRAETTENFFQFLFAECGEAFRF